MSASSTSFSLARTVVDEANNLAIIKRYVPSDEEFARFCTAFGLSAQTQIDLQPDHVNRVFLALMRWCGEQTRSRADLANALNRFAPALVVELGLGSWGEFFGSIWDSLPQQEYVRSHDIIN